jgi:hypothetical protein
MSVVRGPGSGASAPVRILSVPEDRPVTVRLLGGYAGLITHWHAKRSHPCQGERDCPPLLHRSRKLWKGYAPAEEWFAVSECWNPCVLEITEALEEALSGRKLRGEIWLLSRESKGKDSGAVIGLFAGKADEQTLRPAFPVEAVLCRFYHVETLNLGVPNPVPKKLWLEDVAGNPPVLPKELTDQDPKQMPATREQIEEFRRQLRQAGLVNTPLPAAKKNRTEQHAPGVNGKEQRG